MSRRNIIIPDEIYCKVIPLMRARGFKVRSKYICDLIQRDFDGALVRQLKPEEMLSGISSINSGLIEQKSSLKASRNELLQRIFILTKIVVELYFKLVSSQTSAEQMQAKLDAFIDEAKRQYPIAEN